MFLALFFEVFYVHSVVFLNDLYCQVMRDMYVCVYVCRTVRSKDLLVVNERKEGAIGF